METLWLKLLAIHQTSSFFLLSTFSRLSCCQVWSQDSMTQGMCPWRHCTSFFPICNCQGDNESQAIRWQSLSQPGFLNSPDSPCSPPPTTTYEQEINCNCDKPLRCKVFVLLYYTPQALPSSFLPFFPLPSSTLLCAHVISLPLF